MKCKVTINKEYLKLCVKRCLIVRLFQIAGIAVSRSLGFRRFVLIYNYVVLLQVANGL